MTRSPELPVPTPKQEFRTLLGLSLPLTAAYVAEMGMVITDMIIVGRLGSDALAAVGLAGDWFWVLLVIGMGTLAMVGVIAAQCLGAGDRQGVIEAGEQGMLAAIVTSLPVMLCAWYLGPLLGLTGQDPAIVGLITSYARMLTIAVLPALWVMVLRNYVTALSHSAVIGWITVLALVLNAALNYSLVYGKFGLPPLGVTGAGLGTAIVNWLMFAALAVYVRTAAGLANYRPRLIPRRARRALQKDIFFLGIPMALTESVNGATFTVAAVVMGTIGAAALAAQQIVYSVLYLALSAAAAVGDAVRVRVAHGIGGKSVDASNRSAHVALLVGGLASLLAAMLLWLFPHSLVRVFLDTSDHANRGTLTLAIALSGYAGALLLLDGVQIVLVNAVRGLRDTRSPLLVGIVGYWIVGLGTGIWMCLSMDLGPPGLWSGMIAGAVLANVMMYWKFKRRIAGIRTQLDH